MTDIYTASKSLSPKIYKYYETVRKQHPDKEIQLVGENAGGHAKVEDVIEDVIENYCEEHGILKAPHPPNSPDLEYN